MNSYTLGHIGWSPNYKEHAKMCAGGFSDKKQYLELVDVYIASIETELERWKSYKESAMQQGQFSHIARYGDVCDALEMTIKQARKILTPNI
jgi:hypothetical protein